jgi:hypothetical protein
MIACRPSLWPVPGLLAILLLNCGCGTNCEAIRQTREQFLDRQGATDDPHMVLAVPLRLVNGLIKKNLKTVKAASISLPGIGQIAPGHSRLWVKPHSVVVTGVRKDRVVFLIALKLGVGTRELLGTKLEVEGSITFNARLSALELGFHPDSLRAAAPPKIDKKAVADLVAAVKHLLPHIPLSILGGTDMDSIVHTAVNQLLKSLYKKMPKKLLGGLSSLATIRVTLPSFPLRSMEIRETATKAGPVIDVSLYTSLPVATGLHPETTLPGSFSTSRARLRMSGTTATELANHAMKSGTLPSRYDDEGNANQEGPWTVGLGWATGARPAKLFAWKTEERCMFVRFGGEPRLAALKRKVRVDLEDGKLEQVKGPFALEAGAFLGLANRSLEFSTQAVSTLEFTLAGKTLKTRIVEAKVKQDELIFDLDIR